MPDQVSQQGAKEVIDALFMECKEGKDIAKILRERISETRQAITLDVALADKIDLVKSNADGMADYYVMYDLRICDELRSLIQQRFDELIANQ